MLSSAEYVLYAVHFPGAKNTLADTHSLSVGQVGTWRGAAWSPLSSLAVGDCIGVAFDLIQNSLSGSTWSSYTKVWREWGDFLQRAGVGMDSSEVRHLLIHFICLDLTNGVSISAMNHKLAGLAFLFKLWGIPEFTKDFLVK